MKAYYELSGYRYVADAYWDWEMLVSGIQTLEEAMMYRAKSKAEDSEYMGHKIQLVVDVDIDPVEEMH